METVINRVWACLGVCVCACVGVCLFPFVRIECQVLNREIYYFFYGRLMLSHMVIHVVHCTTQFLPTEQSVCPHWNETRISQLGTLAQALVELGL